MAVFSTERSAASLWTERATEATAAVVLTLAALELHLVFFRSAGPLWRDEVTSVVMATRPRFRDVLVNLHDDSFPVLWHGAVRLWSGIGLGRADLSLRGLGLVAGVGVLVALWHNARRFGAATPIVSVALSQFTAITLSYGDSIRGYGLGMCLGLVAIGTLWQVARSGTPARWCVALLASLLSVHMVYFNGTLLLAACCGAAAVCLVNRRWRRAALVLGLGVACAASMLAYRPVFRRRAEVGYLFQGRQSGMELLGAIPGALCERPQAASSPLSVDRVWAGTVAVGLCVAAAAWPGLAHGARGRATPTRESVVFCGVTMLVGVPAYGATLLALHYSVMPRYLLSGLVMVATCADGLFAALPRNGLRTAAVAGSCLFCVENGPSCWQAARVRMSNVDRVAHHLGDVAGPDDLVVVDPWWLGVPFHRYYRGPTAWTTVPPVAETDYQRYGFFLSATRDPRAIDPVLDRVAATLRGGHRVWVVTVNDVGFTLRPPPVPTPPPAPGAGEFAYYQFWNNQIQRLISAHASVRREVIAGTGQEVNPLETAFCYEADGWRGDVPTR